MRANFRIGILLLAVCSLATALRAEPIPQPVLRAIYPMGGQVGHEFELIVYGDTIDGDQKVVFSNPSIVATPVMVPADRFYPDSRPMPNHFKVKVGDDVAPGLYEARVVNGQGNSNARSFVVDRLAGFTQPRAKADPNTTFVSPNAQAKDALRVSVDATINGACAPQTSDFYIFSAKKGQRLIIHCAAQLIDSRADAVLDILDSSGARLQEVHDAVRQDSTMDFTAPADADYLLSIHDFLYRGGPEYGYRISLCTGPWLEFIDPPFTTFDAEGQHTVYGRNLPGSQPAEGITGSDGRVLEKLTVSIKAPAKDDSASLDTVLRPIDTTIPTFSYRLKASNGISNPVRLAIVSGSVLKEQEPNDTPQQAQELTAPAQILGAFNPRNDRDWYSFHAKKGQKLWIEVVSQRLGLPTDPTLLVQRGDDIAPKGGGSRDVAEADDYSFKSQGGGDDPRYRISTDDPILNFVAPEEGSYRLLVRDLYATAQGSPRLAYLLSLHEARPDFRLIGVYGRSDLDNGGATPNTAVLRKNGSVQIEVLALRRDGFDGVIQLEARGLPAGVTAAPALLGPGITTTTFVLRASPDAQAWTGTISLVGHADIDGATVTRPVQPVEPLIRQNDGNAKTPTRVVSEMRLAVRDDAACPAAVTAEEKTFRVARGGKLQIPLKITRAADYKGALQLTPRGLPQQIRLTDPQPLPIEVGADQKPINLDIDASALPGTYALVMNGSAPISYIRNPKEAQRAADDKKRINAIADQNLADARKAADARQRAEAAAAQAQAMVVQFEQKRVAAKQAADAAALRQKEAEAKLPDLKSAVDKAQAALDQANAGTDAAAVTAAQEKLKAARTLLDAASTAATGKAKAQDDAASALAKAIKDKSDGQDKATAAEADRKKAVDDDTKAKEDSRLAEEARRIAVERDRAATEASRPRDLKIVVSTSPIIIEVVNNPFTLDFPKAAELKAGGDVELAASIKRDLDFSDEIKFELQPGDGGGGLGVSAKLNTLAKGDNDAKITLIADPATKPGPHTCKILARYRINNRDLTLEQPIEITVTPAEKKPK